MAYITWLGKTGVTESADSTLTKTGGTPDVFDAGAYSSESAASGAIEVRTTVVETNTSRLFGLSNATDAAADANFTNIDFSIFLFNGDLYAVENGSVTNLSATFATGNVVGVRVTEDGKVQYFKNASVLLERASPTLNYPLVADCSLQTANSTLAECEIILPGGAAADDDFPGEINLGGDWLAEAFSPFADDEIIGQLELGGDVIAEAFAPFADDEIIGELALGGDFAEETTNEFADDDFDGDLNLAGDFAAEAYTPGDAIFDGGVVLGGDWECDTALVLSDPEPVLRTVAEDAFSNQRWLGGRFYINNVLTPFVRAEINAPAGTLGTTCAVELAKTDLAQLPDGASFKLQIGKRIAGNPVWTTIVDGAKLTSRQFRMSSGRDGLNISVKSAAAKLDKFPKNNLIVYDAAKAEVATDEIEPLYTNTSETITTTAVAVSVLTLYKLLDIAFVEGCGFSAVETDIPNYEIARCDFSVTNSYASSVAQFLGMYEPDFRIEDDVLLIQKTIDPLPPDYAPNPLPASRYPNFSEALQNALSSVDGYIVSYMAAAGAFYVDRNLPDVVEPSGTFGEADFIETTIKRRMRDWFETGEPVAVRSELKKETRETRNNGVIVGRETKENTFDRLGRATGYTNTIEARMPDVMQENAPTLLKTREESQKIRYKTNPFNPRQTVTSKIETASRALLAVDSENTALDENGEDSPYGQDYERVFEAGNLKSEMTSEFRTLETVVEYFRPTASGQIECRTERFDALRGKMKPSPPSDTRSGDISVLNFQRQKQRTIFRDGVTQATRTGELQTLNAGELPLLFAAPLAEWLLEHPPITGQIEVVGYDESLERGVSFNLRGRSDADLGNFKVRGYSVVIEPQSIVTNIEALKV